MWMVANAVASLVQSVKAWASVYQFHIPDYEDEIAEARVYIERAGSTLIPMLESNTPNLDVLNRVDDWLLSAHNILQRTSKDLQKKIVEAKTLRSQNFFSAGTKVASIVTNYLSYKASAAQAAETSLKALTIGSNLVHGICTIGDLIASGKAHTLVSHLEIDSAKVKHLQTQRQILAAQVRTLR
ncbi:unnamed protein product [Didymodactylos carnosus]|uniref:Uncharacterized protein n=1 Tax=Didymodactylos carnosus TaxID=1234261 RepID=A0A815ZZD5_9BILA|nr:unnamed protein product [Didymodactylos carnosus]CAF4460326.1 unnamed protein product [Didymodactylos carnosus]